jgi:hypothetical protein
VCQEKRLYINRLQQFWRSPFNVFDLILTFFCALTLLVIAFAGCGAHSKGEEIFDTLLLVARNVLQFGRLAAVMRQYVPIIYYASHSFVIWHFGRSGQSIFSRPKHIDLTAARRAGYTSLDLDIEDEAEADSEELDRPLLQRDPVLFDAGSEQRPAVSPQRKEAVHDRDLDDVWAELG